MLNSSRTPGRHFLQIPGPTPVPERILRAMHKPTIDHRGPEFQDLARRVLDKIKRVFRTTNHVVIYPASGTGAWEAALTNALSAGDRVLMTETGHFSILWRSMAERLAIDVDFIPSDWRSGADPNAIENRLRADNAARIKAVCVVHNETSTGCVSPIADIRRAIDVVGHPTLLMVDTISSLASIDYRHDDWGVDVTVAGSQKGLMMPPGMSFNAVSAKALEASRSATLRRAFWSWLDIIAANSNGFFPYTPATNMLYGLGEALDMLDEEGLENVFDRHRRHAEAVRRAVLGWDLEIFCRVPEHYSSSLTAVLLPVGHDADAFRADILRAYDMSLGAGLSKIAGKVFRIGHLGDINDLTILGALAGVEMGLELADVPHRKGGVQKAMDYLAECRAHRATFA
jgi:alanine-glyoxylate transaminase / serine-glyoxylate transaminase / serine-pyruvate transaminase